MHLLPSNLYCHYATFTRVCQAGFFQGTRSCPKNAEKGQKNLLTSQRLGAIWLLSSATANSVYRFIRYQQNRKPTSCAVPDKPARCLGGQELTTQTDRFSRKRDDKSLCDSNIAQCVIPAKLVLDSDLGVGIHSGGRLLDTCFRRYDKVRRYDKAFAGMTRRTGQFEQINFFRWSARGD